MSQYTTYERFFNTEEAAPILAILKQYAIPFEFSAIPKTVDAVIVGGGPSYLYEVKISPEQFEPVNRLLRDKIKVDLDEVDPDYYLFSFDDFELVEIINNPDEWGRLDFVIARKILETRGIVYTTEELDAIRNKKIETLAQPENEEKGWVNAGYFFALSGGFLGILIGLVLLQSTKTLPDGRKMHRYDKATRKQAKTILFLSLIVFAVCLTLKLTGRFDLFFLPVINT